MHPNSSDLEILSWNGKIDKYCNSLYTCTYTQQDDPATPRETLLGANIAFRGLLKMSTAEQLCPSKVSLLEWKDCANTVIPFTHVEYTPHVYDPEFQYLLNLSIPRENFEARAVRLYSFSATPGKQCLPPKVSLGGLRDRPVEYTTCVKGITVFAQSFHSKRASKGNYSICSIFPFQERISRPELFGCTHFQQPPESNVCPQKCL